MADKKKSENTTELVRKDEVEMEQWEKDLLADAQKAQKQEAGVGFGNFFSTQGGVLKLNDAPIPGNEIAVCVLDSVVAKAFYAQKFKPGVFATPSCYAFSRDENLVPHEAVKEPCSESCLTCPNNVRGTADGGERAGKACADRRRLAVIPVGTMSRGVFQPATDSETLQHAEIAFLSVPPTSLKAWAGYVKGVAASVSRPPYAVFTSIKLAPDAKDQFHFEFVMLAKAPNELIPLLRARHAEAEATIIFPYPTMEGTPEVPAGKPAKRKF